MAERPARQTFKGAAEERQTVWKSWLFSIPKTNRMIPQCTIYWRAKSSW